MIAQRCQTLWLFLSTLSLRRATGTDTGIAARNPISIHALLAESDDTSMPPTFIFAAFLSTLSLRRATRTGYHGRADRPHFYPRSPCGERHNTDSRVCHRPDFYPRSPCGERLKIVEIGVRCLIFLSTLSLRRATKIGRSNQSIISHFYPRSPCGERHKISNQCEIDKKNFYPRSPCGERRDYYAL